MWIIGQGGNIPGEQLAQSVLNANAIQAMQLIVFLVVLGWVISTWLNGRAVKEMSGTNASMGRTNEKFYEADAKKTTILQGSLDELRLMREGHDRDAKNHQRGLEEAVKAIKAHDDKAEAYVEVINAHTTARSTFVSDAVTNLMVEAVRSVNKATSDTVAPALEALIEIKASFAAINTLQKSQMELYTQQQEGYQRIMDNLLARAEKIIVQSINDTESKPDEKPESLEVPGPVPDAVAVPALVSDGGNGPDSAAGLPAI